MVESITQKNMEDLGLSSTIEGYYVEENPKSIRIKLPDSITFWVPKRFIDSHFFRECSIKQEFVIDNWLLRKIGFRFEKYQEHF